MEEAEVVDADLDALPDGKSEKAKEEASKAKTGARPTIVRPLQTAKNVKRGSSKTRMDA